MKLLILLVGAVAFNSAAEFDHELVLNNIGERASYNSDDTLFEGVYVAPLDPFSPTKNIRLNLHYSVNVHHLERDGPLFLFTHFEDNSGNRDLHTEGLAYDMARMLGGGLIKASFRYLGQNFFGNSTEQEELSYLTLDHILADIPHLVNKVRADLNLTRSPVVAFGSRIGGAVAILARKKFPHIIDGAWSSSGLFRSVMAETDYYNDVARQVHTLGGAECSKRLSKAFQQVKGIVDAKNETKLREIFKITGPLSLDDSQDVQHFYWSLFAHLSYFVHIEGRDNSRGAIQNFCEDMNEYEDALESYLYWHRVQWGDARPNFSYQNSLQVFQSIPRWRAYKYFYCTQFGSKRFVTTANNFENVYPHVITEQYYDQFCSDLFGAKYNRTLLERASDNFNLQYGGENQYVSGAIFSEGNLNPYRGSGVTNYNNKTSEFVSTQFFAADADMDEEDEDDAAELKAAKTKISEALFQYAYVGDDVE